VAILLLLTQIVATALAPTQVKSEVQVQKSSTQPTIPESVFKWVKTKSLLKSVPYLGISLRSFINCRPLLTASSIAALSITHSSRRHLISLSISLFPRLVILISNKILIKALQPVYDPKVLYPSIKDFFL